MQDERRVYTTTEAAAYLTRAGIACKRGAVRKWIAEGKLRATKWGGVWYVTKAELDRFLDRLAGLEDDEGHHEPLSGVGVHTGTGQGAASAACALYQRMGP